MDHVKVSSIAAILTLTTACPPAGHRDLSPSVHRKVIVSSRDAPVSMSCQRSTNGLSRAMIRTANVSINVEHPAVAFHRVTAETKRRGGYVAQARQYSRSASLTLRIPSSRLEEALCLLARLGEVTQLSINSNDAASQVEAAAARVEQLTQLRRTEASKEAFAHWVITQLEAARREKQRLDDQIQLATIQVTIAAA
jgi:hypothetical protein